MPCIVMVNLCAWYVRTSSKAESAVTSIQVARDCGAPHDAAVDKLVLGRESFKLSEPLRRALVGVGVKRFTPDASEGRHGDS